MVRQRSAKPSFTSSNLVRTSKKCVECFTRRILFCKIDLSTRLALCQMLGSGQTQSHFLHKKVEHTQEIQYNKSARNKTADPGLGKRQKKALAYKQKARCRMFSAACFLFGGEYRDRTGDLLHAMQALSQLS